MIQKKRLSNIILLPLTQIEPRSLKISLKKKKKSGNLQGKIKCYTIVKAKEKIKTEKKIQLCLVLRKSRNFPEKTFFKEKN